MGQHNAKEIVITTHTDEEFLCKIYRYECVWIIKDFRTLAPGTGNSITSQKLTTDCMGQQDQWEIVFYPDGFNERTTGYASIYLRKVTNNERKVQFTCEIPSNKANEREIVKKSIKKTLSLESILGWTAFCKRNIIDDDTLIDGCLTLKYTLQVYEDSSILNPALEDEDPFLEETLSELSNNVKALLHSEQDCDVVFKVGGERIKAHKAILAARSPIFRAMFDSELEKDGKDIIVSDISKEGFREMLLFLYSGECRVLPFETAFDLYYTADKYMLWSLRRICCKILISNLNVDNVVRVLELANRHSDETLKTESIRFIAQNASEIQEREDWLELMRNFPDLANAVFKCLMHANSAGVKNSVTKNPAEVKNVKVKNSAEVKKPVKFDIGKNSSI